MKISSRTKLSAHNLIMRASCLSVGVIAAFCANVVWAEEAKTSFRAAGFKRAPLVFADGHMASIQDYRSGFGHFVLKLNKFDQDGNLIAEHIIEESASHLEWAAGNPDGSVWIYDTDSNLIAWDEAAQSYSMLPLLGNVGRTTKAIVNNRFNLVLFNNSEKALIEYDINLNPLYSAEYSSCQAQQGFFNCVTNDGVNEYVDANTFNVYLNADQMPIVESRYLVTVGDDRVITIIDQQETELFSRLVLNADLIHAEFADDAIAFIFADGRYERLVVTDWDGQVLLDDRQLIGDRTVAFHPAGYVLWGDYKTQLIYPLNVTISDFTEYDYLGSSNPVLMNEYDIQLGGTGPVDPVEPEQPTDPEPEQPTTPEPEQPENPQPEQPELESSSSSGGGAGGSLLFGLALLATLRRLQRVSC
ncbi:hypothetical protein IC617_07610 [Neiella sp. HB171785]|uniref:Uncharacterized protein n=1 Tax=Neiella litorisoli TaxID=2771431 RepID=A0A8J6QTY6_9GAMM|nr:hypothetical protein [Neiella litorisoli]MBD1389287.1 hypothetical protein [Neiella litorisoli]